MARLLAIIAMIAALAGPALGYEPDEVLKNPKLEERARELSSELRCLVCQNQSIDDSDAPLAKDLRILIRERLKAGDSDQQVIDFVVARYGEFVLLRPRFAPHTWALWLAPLVALLGGGLLLWARRPTDARDTGADAPLDKGEEARLSALLGDRDKEGGES